MLFAATVSFAQTFPFETEASRKPRTVTGGNCLIRGARVLTATKGTLENTDILVENGKISRLGVGLTAPGNFTVIDARGKVVTPGIIDGHSHRASDGTNEGADSITGEVRIGDTLNPSAFNVWQALASGHTAAVSLHGSANAIGGQSVVIKYKYGRPVSEFVVSDAPRMIKFALGENVTRKTDTSGSRFPRTRMGQEAVYRRAFTAAKQYKAEWDAFRANKTDKPPRRDLRLETLADILDRKVWVQCHSYRSDEMLMMVRLSQEFGFKIGAMQHALEAYKIAPELAAAGVGVSMFVDSWSFKQEGYDAIPWNAAICMKAGVTVSINTDGLSGTTALNIDAAKTMRYGGLTEEQALQTLTINPAKELGIDKRTGSIEVGKDADLVLWDGHPLSVYSKCAMTLIEGEVYFERRDAFGIDALSISKPILDRKVNFQEAKPLAQGSTYAIVGASIFPVSGPEMPNGRVTIKDGKILAVGKDVPIPKGAIVVNGRGLRVYPGFIDGYSSMGLAEISPIPVMMDNQELGGVQPDLDALTSLWVESAHFGPARYSGVTNSLSAPGGGTVSGQAAVVHTSGLTTEQFGLLRKAALIVNFSAGGPSFDFDVCEDIADANLLLGLGGSAGSSYVPQPSGDEHLTLAQLERYYDLLGGAAPVQAGGSDTGGSVGVVFEKALAYVKTRSEKPDSPVDLGMEAMIPYLNGQKLVIINARNAASIRSAVAFIKKYKLKAAISGASEAWREAALLKESGVPVIISPAGRSTLSANNVDRAWDPYDTPYVAPGLLAKAGVKFCFQSGAGFDAMNLPVRVGEHCAYGLRPEDAIRALTLSAAEILGVSDKIGSIEPGKLGNLVITDGDPFEMTSTIRYVFINGVPASLVTKHTMLRDKYAGRK
jgi:imidazolonepropionase-like amidohydrolase